MEVPDYIQEEIDKYIEEKNRGKARYATYENVFLYINMAQKAGRITKEEANKIKDFVRQIK